MVAYYDSIMKELKNTYSMALITILFVLIAGISSIIRIDGDSHLKDARGSTSLKLSGYDDGIIVNTIFGTGRATTTDSVGLTGEVNQPVDCAFDPKEEFLYFTDMNGGGLIRKLLVVDKIAVFPFKQKFSVETVFAGVNCDYCEFLATGKSGIVYTSSRANNLKKLDRGFELNQNYRGEIMSGSPVGFSICSNTPVSGQVPCYGDSDGVGTFARFNRISAIALKVDSLGFDESLFIAERINNKIRLVELLSGNFATSTFATNVDTRASFLQGIAVNSATNTLYAAVTAGIYSYSITAGSSSKSAFAGQMLIVGPAQGYYDGSLLGARFGLPNYVTLDGLGNLYVSDHLSNNYHSIRKISIKDSNVTTLAGKTFCTPTTSTYFDNSQWCFTPGEGPLLGRVAKFNTNTGLAVGKRGNVMFIADTLDNIIRQLYCTTGFIFINGTCSPGATVSPSARPSCLPTLLPSVSPSRRPSFSPSRVPTRQPSICPTVRPSLQPSVAPSRRPTFSSTIFPSRLPTICPSFRPSLNPSYSPSSAPSRYPTFRPSAFPTTFPSYRPSTSPTFRPSSSPSLAPLFMPSIIPTSYKPTVAPTMKPSLLPSKAPSNKPSQSPTFMPTRAPTRAPTLRPVTPPPTTECSALDFVKTPAGNGCPTSCDGAEFIASFHKPSGVAINNAEDTLFIVDYGASAVRRMDVSTGIVETIVQRFVWKKPLAIAITPDDTVFITDMHRLMMVTPTNLVAQGTAVILAGSRYSGDYYRECSKSGPGPRGEDLDCIFNTPTGIDVDSVNKFVYVADKGNNIIHQVSYADPANPIVITILDDFALNSPFGVVVDTDSQMLYVSSFGGHCIYQITLTGYYPVDKTSLSVFAGSEEGFWGHKDGIGIDAMFMSPTGIAMDCSGDLYVNEWFMVPGETGSSTSGGDSTIGGSGGSAALGSAIAGYGSEPQYLHNVRRISTRTSVGKVSTIAGGHLPGIFDYKGSNSNAGSDPQETKSLFSDGFYSYNRYQCPDCANTVKTPRRPGSAANVTDFNASYAYGYAYDVYSYGDDVYYAGYIPYGNAVAADPAQALQDEQRKLLKNDNNQRRRRLDPTYNGPGVHSVGTVALEDGSFADGFAVYARFFNPMGITVTCDGNIVWLADNGNNKIRNITCVNRKAPTLEPTAVPTFRPTPVPTELPTRNPTTRMPTMVTGAGSKKKTSRPIVRSPTRAPPTKSPSGAVSTKNGRVVVVNRSNKATIQQASAGTVANDYTQTHFGMSAAAIGGICGLAVSVAFLIVGVLFCRRRGLQAAIFASKICEPTSPESDSTVVNVDEQTAQPQTFDQSLVDGSFGFWND